MRNEQKFHFIGIGGISMSALAMMLHEKGYYVQGSNIEENECTRMLAQNGIKIYISHKKENLDDCTVAVWGSAIQQNNPELLEAKNKGLLIQSRSTLLGSIAKDFEKVIAVSGSHGKTTTTSMIAHVLKECGKEPTVHVGGIMQNYSSNFIIGSNKIFVTEACEYKNNYHSLSPSTLIVLNIEADHLDFFKTFSALEESFQKMVCQSEKVIAHHGLNLILPQKAITFCVEENCKDEIINTNDFQNRSIIWACNLCCSSNGCCSFMANFGSEELGMVYLNSPCEHNVSNALAAIVACLDCDIPFTNISNALETFKGVERRFQNIGNINQAPLIHDYAHHPTEITSTIKSASTFTCGNIITVFEPHTYSRTLSLMSQFVESLLESDQIIILPTYSAREERVEAGSAETLFAEISKLTNNIEFKSTYKEAYEFIQSIATENDTILLLGAGNINNFLEK